MSLCIFSVPRFLHEARGLNNKSVSQKIINLSPANAFYQNSLCCRSLLEELEFFDRAEVGIRSAAQDLHGRALPLDA